MGYRYCIAEQGVGRVVTQACKMLGNASSSKTYSLWFDIEYLAFQQCAFVAPSQDFFEL